MSELEQDGMPAIAAEPSSSGKTIRVRRQESARVVFMMILSKSRAALTPSRGRRWREARMQRFGLHDAQSLLQISDQSANAGFPRMGSHA